ncbi:MAG: glycosyltransferase family 4 protein [Gemmatimonadaceae bacterium]|nr:glycosyltransferase family 4 protein [Gemmatimonadaceae bacterium]
MRLRKGGHRVSFIAITRSEREQTEDVYYPGNSLQLLQTIARIRPDVVHLHLGGNFTLRLALLCAVVGLWPGMRSVLTFHSGGFPSSPRGQRAGYWTFEGFAVRTVDHVVAVNVEIADVFRRYGIAEERLSVVAPYARLDKSTIAASLPDALGEFKRAHTPLFLSVGLLESEYCLELQIDAMELLRQEWPQAGLVIIGSGSLEEALRQRVANSPSSSHILMTGNVPHRYTLRAIAEADVLLRTTAYDGDAVSVREAVQIGTPVVASNTCLRPRGVHVMRALTVEALVQSCQVALSVPAIADAESDRDELDRIETFYVSAT